MRFGNVQPAVEFVTDDLDVCSQNHDCSRSWPAPHGVTLRVGERGEQPHAVVGLAREPAGSDALRPGPEVGHRRVDVAHLEVGERTEVGTVGEDPPFCRTA